MLVGALKKGLRFAKRAINAIVLIFYFGWLFSVGRAKLKPGYIWMGWPGSQENRLRRVFSPGTVLLDVDQLVAKDWQGRLVAIGQHEKRHFFSQLDAGIDFQNTEYFRIMLSLKRQIEAQGAPPRPFWRLLNTSLTFGEISRK